MNADPVPSGPPVATYVDPGRGLGWWADAFGLFMRAPWLWLAMALIALLAFVLVSFVPLLGSIVSSLAVPVLAGGWVIAADKIARGQTAEVGDLFACFRRNDLLTPLLVVGALLAGAMLVVFAVAAVLGAGAAFGLMSGGWGGGPQHGGSGVLVAAGAGMTAVLLVVTVGLLATAAVWFAPALVIFHAQPPVNALRASFLAVLKNVLPFLIYGVIQIILAAVASVPLGLGWIVLVPVMGLTMYTSYKDVFGAA
jgi:uncharacterized membrane protein